MVDISINNLSFFFYGSIDPALDDINLKIPKGTFMLISGPSGGGKSTLVDCINGLIPHRYNGRVKGTVYIDGVDWFDIDYRLLCQKIGLVRQNPDTQLAFEDVKSEVAFGPENLCLSRSEIEKRVDWALKAVDALSLKDRKIKSLSGGEKQRIAIASMLTMKPEVLILDEPSSYLDISGIQTLYESLISLRALMPDMTLIIVDHELFYILPLVDQLIIIKKGKIIIKGDPTSLILKSQSELENAGVRLHPALINFFKTDICSCTQKRYNKQPKFNFEILNKLFIEQFKLIKPHQKNFFSFEEPLIEIRNLSFHYSNNSINKTIVKNKEIPKKEFILNNINLKVNSGDFICIMGNNGSGKTTLLRLLIGQLKPASGTILYQNHDINNIDSKNYASHIGIIFQNPEQQFFKRTVLDEIYYGPDNFNIKKENIKNYIITLISLFKLEQYSTKLPFCLSWGEKRRVNIASILSYLPNLLLLDEIFIGQDMHNIKIILEILKGLNQKLKQTIVISSHKPDIIMNLANRIILLDKGNIIIDGSTEENLDNISNFFYNHHEELKNNV